LPQWSAGGCQQTRCPTAGPGAKPGRFGALAAVEPQWPGGRWQVVSLAGPWGHLHQGGEGRDPEPAARARCFRLSWGAHRHVRWDAACSRRASSS
jgi:hypothetical protein